MTRALLLGALMTLRDPLESD
ncbi:hypothetical protein LINPERHAP1_LOCUS1558 [Linum perenne]